MSEIDKEILEYYQGIEKLSVEEKKWIHYKSVSNIIYHLIHKSKINSKKNKKLQELGAKRNKKILLEYFEVIKQNIPKNKDDSHKVYEKYVEPVGEFMMKYYKFSNFAGVSIIIYFFIVVTIAAIIGFATILIFKSRLIYISLSSLIVLYSIIKILIKHKKKRIFGFLY